jgi:hypothetical protein
VTPTFVSTPNIIIITFNNNSTNGKGGTSNAIIRSGGVTIYISV